MNKSEQPINFHEELLVQMQPRLFGYILGLLANPSDAKDVLQETNRVILSKMGDFQQPGNFSAWTHKFAYYQCLAFRQKMHRSKLSFDSELIEQLSDAADPINEATEQNLPLLSICLEKLQPKTRAIVADYYYEEEPVSSIAENRNLKQNNVAQILYRARKALFECIQKEARNQHV
ncbi:MAG: sigma-70 family RNA polymerase sigma factor [Verrucomicrobia bacterium]|nr:sigma-70 family RNA polymerase sigma factor [Verrucomicrobiota bacterium]